MKDYPIDTKTLEKWGNRLDELQLAIEAETTGQSLDDLYRDYLSKPAERSFSKTENSNP